jgi:DNA-binding IclR family transcriptional regulator
VPRPRSGPNALYSASLDALDQLPEIFDKNDLCRILGYSPHRASLHRLFRDLVKHGWLVVEDPRGGRWPIRYRKLSSPSSNPA